MKKLVFSFLGIFILGLSGCKRDKGDTYDYYPPYMPAIVGYNFDLSSPTLITSQGTFIAPQLGSVFYYQLFTGDALLVDIVVNRDQQPSEEYTVVWDLTYSIVMNETPQATDGGVSAADDFDAPIDDMSAYDMVKNVAFLFFFHTAPGFQQYFYEMTYDPEQAANDDVPVVYFRAKKDGEDKNETVSFRRICAFDMDDFIKTYKKSENELKIHVKFKIGEEDGKEIFKDWEGNPLTLKIM